jgi:hypothetical protein
VKQQQPHNIDPPVSPSAFWEDAPATPAFPTGFHLQLQLHNDNIHSRSTGINPTLPHAKQPILKRLAAMASMTMECADNTTNCADWWKKRAKHIDGIGVCG